MKPHSLPRRLAGLASRRRWTATAAALVLAAGTAGLAATSADGATSDGSRAHVLNHVFIIMLENHEADHVIGDASMPFLTSLASSYGQATDYFGVTHPSEPNYIAATSGDTWWVNNDNGWAAGNQYDHANIVDELSAAGIPWDAYMEAMPSAGYLPDTWPAGGSLYVSKHNPFILYNDVRFDPSRAGHIKPYTALAADLNGPNPPRYAWISPDQCNDLHGGVYSPIAGHPETPCPYNSAPGDLNDEALKAKADAFIKGAVTTIMSSRAWTGHSVIFIAGDESDYDGTNPANNYYNSAAGCCDSPVFPPGDPQVSASWPGGVYGGGSAPMVVISRLGPRHATDSNPANHYSMLLTIEEGFGLGKLGYTGDANQVQPLWPLITG